MKIKYLTTILISMAALCPSARAVTYLGEQTAGYAAHYTSTSDTYLVGTVIHGLVGNNGQVARDVDMTNNLLSVVSGQNHVNGDGQVYSNTGLFNGPQATAAGAVTNFDLGMPFPDGFVGPVTIDLNAVGTFTYLVVAYDGPNNGAIAVWNIAGLTGTIQFDAYGKPEAGAGLDGWTGNLLGSNGGPGAKYKITSFTLLNPTGIPDGGTTVMLLGMGLGAVGMVRRYLTR